MTGTRSISDLATKADVRAEIAGLENRMLKIAFGIVAGQAVLTVGLLRLLGMPAQAQSAGPGSPPGTYRRGA